MFPSTLTSPPSVDSAVRLTELSKTYPNGPEEITALQGISLAIEPGAFIAIMGPSRSGKSTFLNLAAGFDTPAGGQVLIGETDITELSLDDVTRFRRRHVDFVFQSYNSLVT